jgi:hypothetical protein
VAGYAVASIAVLTVLVAAILWTTGGNLVFAGTVVWALAAVIVAGRERGADGAVLIAAGTALLAVVAITGWLRLSARGT